MSLWANFRKKDFSPAILRFNEKVREACRSCKRYGKVALCPPFIPSVEYYKGFLTQYQKGELLVVEYDVPKKKEEVLILGRQSSLDVQRQLISIRDAKFHLGHAFVTAFGAGSCKFCSLDCLRPCRFPESGLVAIEGTGVDVRLLVRDVIGEDLIFPVEERFVRVGMVLYDK